MYSVINHLSRKIFTGRARVAVAGLDLPLSVSQSAIDTKMNHLEGLYAENAQRKDVKNFRILLDGATW